jgi:hypothetical protein
MPRVIEVSSTPGPVASPSGVTATGEPEAVERAAEDPASGEEAASEREELVPDGEPVVAGDGAVPVVGGAGPAAVPVHPAIARIVAARTMLAPRRRERLGR